VSGLGDTVVRRSIADVEAEIAAGESAERKARWEARSLCADAARATRRRLSLKLDDLKAKLGKADRVAE
jgi:hypothetical protein